MCESIITYQINKDQDMLVLNADWNVVRAMHICTSLREYKVIFGNQLRDIHVFNPITPNLGSLLVEIIINVRQY